MITALKKNRKKGFTLIEMIVVIAIIVVLLALLVPNMVKYLSDATDTKGYANAKNVFTAATAFAANKRAEGSPATAVSKADLEPYINLGDAEISVTVGADGNVTEATWKESTSAKTTYKYNAATGQSKTTT